MKELLFLAAFVPLDGPVGAARDAALIQSGVKQELELVRAEAEKRVPPVIRHTVTAASAVYRRELIIHDRGVGTWRFTPNSVKASLVWEW